MRRRPGQEDTRPLPPRPPPEAHVGCRQEDLEAYPPAGQGGGPCVPTTRAAASQARAFTFIDDDGQTAVWGQPDTLDIVPSGQGQSAGFVARKQHQSCVVGLSCQTSGVGLSPSAPPPPLPVPSWRRGQSSWLERREDDQVPGKQLVKQIKGLKYGLWFVNSVPITASGEDSTGVVKSGNWKRATH